MTLEQRMENFVRLALDRGLRIEGIAAADEKTLLFHHHFTADQPRNIYSHTKSYMATAVGMAIADGALHLDDTLASFFPEKLPEHPSEELLSIRLRDLLTMTSGFGGAFLMNDDRRAGTGAPDYVAYMLSLPVRETPGRRFCYSTADSILAGRMVEKAVGKSLSLYLFERLFSKLGQGFPLWDCCPQGHAIGGGGMFLSLTEMMKLGQLYLAGGVWNGERLVEESWVREATRLQIETDNPSDVWNCGYGYQFWMLPYPGAYRADGAFGQISAVLPEKGLVIAVQCPEDGDFEQVKLALHEERLSQL